MQIYLSAVKPQALSVFDMFVMNSFVSINRETTYKYYENLKTFVQQAIHVWFTVNFLLSMSFLEKTVLHHLQQMFFY